MNIVLLYFLIQYVSRTLVNGFQTEEICDRGEAFAGAWFSGVSHIINQPALMRYEDGRLLRSKRRIPCEEASWSFFYSLRRNNRRHFHSLNGNTEENKMGQHQTWGNYPHMTIDVFDFSVFHLSTLERLVKGPIRSHKNDVPDALSSMNLFTQKNRHTLLHVARTMPRTSI